eukprot:TRINITY_DN6174_c0_g1_i1.p1 TRINITY_DN6174_c0_g1~~TRINITY_DN6174_c0_g1_i1.p1  ORF type:complete len:707 (+),score=213.97 TRINITY_DN6174_c0_g1_i1:117-2237(+)
MSFNTTLGSVDEQLAKAAERLGMNLSDFDLSTTSPLDNTSVHNITQSSQTRKQLLTKYRAELASPGSQSPQISSPMEAIDTSFAPAINNISNPTPTATGSIRRTEVPTPNPTEFNSEDNPYAHKMMDIFGHNEAGPFDISETPFYQLLVQSEQMNNGKDKLNETSESMASNPIPNQSPPPPKGSPLANNRTNISFNNNQYESGDSNTPPNASEPQEYDARKHNLFHSDASRLDDISFGANRFNDVTNSNPEIGRVSKSIIREGEVKSRKFQQSGLRKQTTADVSRKSRPPKAPQTTGTAVRSSEFVSGKKKYKNSREELKRQEEEKRRKECTFKPKINKYKGGISHVKGHTPEELMNLHQKTMSQRAQAKLNQQSEEEKQCTFRPEINNHSKKIRQKLKQKCAAPVTERLYNSAKDRHKERLRTKQQMEKQMLVSHPFKPSINPQSEYLLDTTKYKPIHERIGDIMRAKHDRRHELQMRHDVTTNYSFEPHISDNSEAIVQTRRSLEGEPHHSGSRAALAATERLAREGLSMTKRKQRAQEALELRESRTQTFHPRINATSAAIVDSNPRLQGGFFERQEQFVKKKERDLQRAAQRLAQQEKCTFKPDVGITDAVLVRTQPQRLAETTAQTSSRLAEHDAMRRDAKLRHLREQHDKQYSYKPSINPVSRAIARPKDVDELASTKAIEARKTRLKKKLDHVSKYHPR